MLRQDYRSKSHVYRCDGTEQADARIGRGLFNGPANGVMRHADAGYDIAIDCAREKNLNLPIID